jgi:hypothetical protein
MIRGVQTTAAITTEQKTIDQLMLKLTRMLKINDEPDDVGEQRSQSNDMILRN